MVEGSGLFNQAYPQTLFLTPQQICKFDETCKIDMERSEGGWISLWGQEGRQHV